MTQDNQLEQAQDHFTNETAQLKRVSKPETFGVNCGATFRAPVRLMARVQSYLNDKHNVPYEQMATTSDAMESLILALGIVDADNDDVSLYFDTRKEVVIEEEQREAEASEEEHESSTDVLQDATYAKLESQLAAFIKERGESDKTREQALTACENAPAKYVDALKQYVEQRIPREEIDLFA